MAVEKTVSINRSYVDNYSIKEFTTNTLVPRYFEDVDISGRTVGMIGLTTETMSNISEDAFNTGTVYLRETFPNRSEIKESIYSHAALFQLSDVFSKSGTCEFLIVLNEEGIVNNMTYDSTSGFYYFYLSKNTVTYVENIPFILDYDIQIKIAKKATATSTDYLFTASYVLDEYSNSISTIENPYIKLSRSKNKYLAMTVTMHQCVRTIEYESIINNTKINYPIIDISYDGKLAGFEVLYKSPDDTDYVTQLQPLVVYSQPLKTPFCYYQMADNASAQILRITFNSKDAYFMPDFNSELKVILYITQGTEGNFQEYIGSNISITPDNEIYNYTSPYDIAAKPISGCTDGADELGIEALQALTVESYRTANALTTENDLDEFFSNYKYRYGDNIIKFIKKRDDIDERLFSSFIIIQNDSNIYKTNVLNLDMNIYEMKHTDTNVFMLEPGLLLTYDDNSNNVKAKFLRNNEKYNTYYNDYLQAIENNEINYLDDKTIYDNPPSYLLRPASYAEYKSRKGIDDKLSVFDINPDDMLEYDNPQNNKFLYINPFLIRFVKSPNIITYYLTSISQTYALDFVDQNEESFVQFIIYNVKVERKFEKEKKFHISVDLMSSITIDSEYPAIDTIEEVTIDDDGYENKTTSYILNDKYNVRNNDLRILFVVKNGLKTVCYTELYPTAFDGESIFTFEGNMYTNDIITSDGYLRLQEDEIYREATTGNYYSVSDTDYTRYNLYDKNGVLLKSDIAIDDVTERLNNGEIEKWCNIVNMGATDRIQIPMTDVTCQIYTLYKRSYDNTTTSLVTNTIDQTNNNFVTFDQSYTRYIWTNVYSTDNNPVTFIKPLASLRSYLEFNNYIEKDYNGNYIHDIMDASITSIPLMNYKIALDSDQINYFMTSFYKQYNYITDVINEKLRTISNIDVKFYNTYGKSRNFIIGDTNELINTVNLKLEMDMWFITGTDVADAKAEVKRFIKSQVESLNSGMNNLFMSNLMRKIEINFAYVDHIRFVSINNYPTEYQTVKNKTEDLNDLTRDERRVYVPEMLVIDEDNITINEYTA